MNHDMGDMTMSPSSSSSMMMGHNTTTMTHHRMMMHMSFYWGKDAVILFSGWPGSGSGSGGMYALSLIVVVILAVLVEWLSHSRIIKPGTNDVVSGVIRTVLHALRMGLAYLVMLAVMSFNGGVFLAVVFGHALGFMIFATRIFGLGQIEKDDVYPLKGTDLPPVSC